MTGRRLGRWLTAAALLVDALMANSLVDLRGRSGVGTDFVWQLPPLLLVAAVAWPALRLAWWARRLGEAGDGGGKETEHGTPWS